MEVNKMKYEKSRSKTLNVRMRVLGNYDFNSKSMKEVPDGSEVSFFNNVPVWRNPSTGKIEELAYYFVVSGFQNGVSRWFKTIEDLTKFFSYKPEPKKPQPYDKKR
jgi:hypothetical protein